MDATGARRDEGFRLLLALALVATRIAIFDRDILAARSIPNHDLFWGAPLFATSMHALRIDGDLA